MVSRNVGVLKGVSFVGCTFDNCKVDGEHFLDSSKEISVIKSTLKDCEIIENYIYHKNTQSGLFDDIEKKILKQLLSISSTKSHHIMQLLHCFDKGLQKTITNSLGNLVNNDYLQIRGNQINFNINKLPIIKTELGI